MCIKRRSRQRWLPAIVAAGIMACIYAARSGAGGGAAGEPRFARPWDEPEEVVAADRRLAAETERRRAREAKEAEEARVAREANAREAAAALARQRGTEDSSRVADERSKAWLRTELARAGGAGTGERGADSPRQAPGYDEVLRQHPFQGVVTQSGQKVGAWGEGSAGAMPTGAGPGEHCAGAARPVGPTDQAVPRAQGSDPLSGHFVVRGLSAPVGVAVLAALPGALPRCTGRHPG